MLSKKTNSIYIITIVVTIFFIGQSIVSSVLTNESDLEDEINSPINETNCFISIWDTTKTCSGSTDTHQIRLSLVSSGIYNFKIDWGDGKKDTIKIWNQAEVTHTYDTAGNYTLRMIGTIIGWQFKGSGDRLKILNITRWGCLRLGNTGAYFEGCENLNIAPVDTLNLTGTTDLSRCFWGCTKLTEVPHMNEWDVSHVTNMRYMFCLAEAFNQPLGHWDVSHVTDMSFMFAECESFNQSLGDWDVSAVTTMESMFAECQSFNQPLGDWDVSHVTDMSFVFHYATNFNQPLGDWDVSHVTNMLGMFTICAAFNQPLANWDVSCVTNMVHMFSKTTNFNQPLGDWNVSKVTDMGYMFYDAANFDQPLGDWNVSKVTNMDGMFEKTTLSTANYDSLLIGWSVRSLQHGVTFHAGGSKYSSAATSARAVLTGTYGWIITDGGQFGIDWKTSVSISF